MYDLIEPLTGFVVVGTQALAAAIIEEKIAMQGDKYGFRDGNGDFRSKGYGILRVFSGVVTIAVVVQFLPDVLTIIFPYTGIQTVGLSLLLAIVLVNIVVDTWNIGVESLVMYPLGKTYRTSLRLVGRDNTTDIPQATIERFDYRTFAVSMLGSLLVLSGYVAYIMTVLDG